MRRRSSRRLGLVLGPLALGALLSGCFTFHHTVGQGPTTGETVSAKQWSAVWGLVTMDEVDSATLAGGASDYRVTTQFTAWDVLVSSVTSFVGLYRQTIVVEK